MAEWPQYSDVPSLLRALRPTEPVYCFHPRRIRAAARELLSGFPGRVLYAVKANDHPLMLSLLHRAGVRHFDCASVGEVARVRAHCPDSHCYFMIPVQPRGDAGEAFRRHAVRHFMIDQISGLDRLARELDLTQVTVFVRMAVHHVSASQDLSSKFGALPEAVPGLMQAVRENGAEPALAFNVGSAVLDPAAYRQALATARRILDSLDFKVRLVDIGGGYPRQYPGFDVPDIGAYLEAVHHGAADLPLAESGELMCEPGRYLSAPAMSALVEVLQRRDRSVYLNDGMYGVFWELRFGMHTAYPVRAWRDGQELRGDTSEFRAFGPTCDSTDVLPGTLQLPAQLQEGDVLEFESIGAYSLSGRTAFNGYWSDTVVCIGDPEDAASGDAGGDAGNTYTVRGQSADSTRPGDVS